MTIWTIRRFLYRRVLVDPRLRCGFFNTVSAAISCCKKITCTIFENLYTDCVGPINLPESTHMNELQAYMSGDTVLAVALGRIEDLSEELGQLRQDLEKDIARLKRILVDALVDDSWRERAAAAVAE